MNTALTARTPVALALAVVAAVAGGMVSLEGHGQRGWLLIMLATIALFAAFGACTNCGRVTGLLIDDRNVMSLSRLQISVWTILTLSAVATAILMKVPTQAIGNWAVEIPDELVFLMGISLTSVTASTLILSGKDKVNVDDPSVSQAKGLMIRSQASEATWRDLLTGESVGNYQHIDISRVQMLYITLVVVLVYGVMVWQVLRQGPAITTLPPLNHNLVMLIAISHAGYLTSKAVQQSTN